MRIRDFENGYLRPVWGISIAATLTCTALATGLVVGSTAGCGKKSDSGEKESAKSATEATSDPSGTEKQSAPAKDPLPVADLPEDTRSHSAPLRFAKNHGGGETDAARALAIAPNGDLVIAGYTKSANLFGTEYTATDSDVFVARLSAKDGEPLWQSFLGGEGEEAAEDVAVGEDNSVVVVGAMAGTFKVGDGSLESAGADDIFITKFAADGRRIYAKRIGANDIDAAHAVSIDAQGNAYVTGVFRQTVEFAGKKISSSGDSDIYLLKLDPNGEILWTKTFGNIGQDFGRDVHVDSQGNLLLLSEISQKVDFGGGDRVTQGNRDIAMAKFDSEGKHLWSRSFGNNYDDMAIRLTTDAADNIVVTGSFEGTLKIDDNALVSQGRSDLFIAKFDTNGVTQWAKGFGGKDKDWGNSVACDAFGNIALAGWFWFDLKMSDTISLKSKGKEDALIAKFDPSGAVLWAQSFGGTSLDMGKSLAFDKEGDLVVTGAYNEKVSFRGEGDQEVTFTPTPGENEKVRKADFFVARFGP